MVDRARGFEPDEPDSPKGRHVRTPILSDERDLFQLPCHFARMDRRRAGGYFAPLIRGYMRRSGAAEDTGIRVALKDRQNALKNPYAHLQIPDIKPTERHPG